MSGSFSKGGALLNPSIAGRRTRPEGMQCRHFPNRDPSDNRLDNLQWGTSKQNAADKVVHGTLALGARHGSAKLTAEDVQSIRADYAQGGRDPEEARHAVQGYSVRDLQRAYAEDVEGRRRGRRPRGRRSRGRSGRWCG